MSTFLIFGIGAFVGVFGGVLLMCLCNMAHDGDKPIDEAQRWAKLQQEMQDEK